MAKTEGLLAISWSSIAGSVAAIALAAWLIRRYRQEKDRGAHEPARFFARTAGILESERLEETGTIGSLRLAGRYFDVPVQVQAVVDTLAIRRLPSLWLLVTIQEALPLPGRLDFMMRPAGPTTFSNFDLLPHTLDRPAGFPEHGVLRADVERAPFPASILAPHMMLFENMHAKELLVTPTGFRLVWLLAEADRARYGVFRQADFGAVDLDPVLLRELLERLFAIRESVMASLKGNP